MKYPWFYTSPNYLPPNIDYAKLEQFYNSTFDHQLGWEPQPNSSKKEFGEKGIPITLKFDAYQKRLDPNSNFNCAPYLVFGDSFALSRQVQDNETICYYLGQKSQQYFPNYGVGNYGLDQAFLRAKKISTPAKYLFIVVPETIVRINTRWRHLHETGNIFGFKSMFSFDKYSSFTLLPNPIVQLSDYKLAYEGFRHGINPFADDPCFLHRFQPEVCNLQRLLSFNKGAYLKLYELTLNYLKKPFSSFYNDKLGLGNRMFFNSLFTASCYSNKTFTDPLEELIRLMPKQLKSDILIFCVPQLSDFQSNSTSRISFFDSISSPRVTIYDLQSSISKALGYASPRTLYVNRSYGGHLNKFGNDIVSDIIASHL